MPNGQPNASGMHRVWRVYRLDKWPVSERVGARFLRPPGGDYGPLSVKTRTVDAGLGFWIRLSHNQRMFLQLRNRMRLSPGESPTLAKQAAELRSKGASAP